MNAVCQDGEAVDLGLGRLGWIVANCCDSRVVHSMEEWINGLLGVEKSSKGNNVEISICELLATVFKRYGGRESYAPLICLLWM